VVTFCAAESNKSCRLYVLHALIVAASLMSAQSHALQNSPILLTLGQPHVSEQRADITAAFEFSAAEGESYLIDVQQNGLDLNVVLRSPDGEIRRFNSPLLRDDRETILLEDATAGLYGIELSSREFTNATASPVIEVIRVDSKLDARIAWQLMTTAAAHAAIASQAAWEKAIVAYEQAADYWRKAGNSRELARSLYAIAAIEYWQMFDWDRSASFAGEAAVLYKESGSKGLSVNATHLQAAALVEKATQVKDSVSDTGTNGAEDIFAEALALFDHALTTQLELNEAYDAAQTTNNIGYLYHYKGDWDKAREYYKLAASRFRQLDEQSGELNPLANLGVLDWEEGDLIAAIETFQRVLAILPPDKWRPYRADTLDNLAGAYLSLGNFNEALQEFSEAFRIHEQIEDIKGQGRSLAGIGTTYYSIGETQLAQEYLERALAVRQEANDGRGEAAVLRYLGNIYRLQGDHTKALESHQAAMSLATSPFDKSRAGTLIGKDLSAAGKADEALDLLDNAMAMADAAHSPLARAQALQASADALLASGDTTLAIDRAEKALEILEPLALETGQAEALHTLSDAYQKFGKPGEALRYARLSVAALERARGRVVNPELRAFYLAARRNYYEFLAGLLIERYFHDGDPRFAEEALVVSEQARARTMIDLLHEASVEINTGAESGLHAKQRYLIVTLSRLRYQRDKFIDEDSNSDRLNKTLADLARIENDLNLLDLEIRIKNPRIAAMASPATLEVEQIQKMLSADSILLQYLLGDTESYVWKVTSDTVDVVRLPDRDSIEDMAQRVHQLLRTPRTREDARFALAAALEELSNAVLPPIETNDSPANKLIIAADGALQFIPFALLNLDEGSISPTRVLDRYEVITVPSMSAVAALRDGPGRETRHTKTVAIIADPVFRDTDERLDSALVRRTGTDLTSDSPFYYQARVLERLPFSLREAEEIADLVGIENRLVALGFDASREFVQKMELDDYRFVHFATHALIDSRYPALSSLALSQYTETGELQDGYLGLHDIYNLRLDADVVVLSACDTALGRNIRGEGLTGLTQAFMYAGADRVLATLWSVSDSATAEFMKHYYKLMLADNADVTPSMALREAQQSMSRRPRWRDPFYWSGFVIQGSL